MRKAFSTIARHLLLALLIAAAVAGPHHHAISHPPASDVIHQGPAEESLSLRAAECSVCRAGVAVEHPAPAPTFAALVALGRVETSPCAKHADHGRGISASRAPPTRIG